MQYAGGWAARQYPGIAEKLLWKSATLQGFFLLHYARDWGRHLARLAGLVAAGKLRVEVRSACISRGSARLALAAGWPGQPGTSKCSQACIEYMASTLRCRLTAHSSSTNAFFPQHGGSCNAGAFAHNATRPGSACRWTPAALWAWSRCQTRWSTCRAGAAWARSLCR